MVFIVAYQIAGITVKVQNLVKNHFIYLFPACLVVDGDMCLEGDVEKKTFRVDRFRRLRLLLMLFEIILGREPETNIVVSISLLLYRLLPTTSANNPPLDVLYRRQHTPRMYKVHCSPCRLVFFLLHLVNRFRHTISNEITVPTKYTSYYF